MRCPSAAYAHRRRPKAAECEGGRRVFCGDFPTQSCIAQMNLFALASLIPAVLALLLMLAAFTAPALRNRSDLRMQTLGYSLIAWLIAGFTFVLGGLPSI